VCFLTVKIIALLLGIDIFLGEIITVASQFYFQFKQGLTQKDVDEWNSISSKTEAK
jgi:hypothetical protein